MEAGEPGPRGPARVHLSHVCARSACLGQAQMWGPLTTGALLVGVWVVAGDQHPLALLTGGGETMVGRSSSGSRPTTWRRWSALQPWSLRGR